MSDFSEDLITLREPGLGGSQKAKASNAPSLGGDRAYKYVYEMEIDGNDDVTDVNRLSNLCMSIQKTNPEILRTEVISGMINRVRSEEKGMAKTQLAILTYLACLPENRDIRSDVFKMISEKFFSMDTNYGEGTEEARLFTRMVRYAESLSQVVVDSDEYPKFSPALVIGMLTEEPKNGDSIVLSLANLEGDREKFGENRYYVGMPGGWMSVFVEAVVVNTFLIRGDSECEFKVNGRMFKMDKNLNLSLISPKKSNEDSEYMVSMINGLREKSEVFKCVMESNN